MARLYDSVDNDWLIASPRHGRLYNEYSNTAVGFRHVHASSDVGGYDKAELYDSALAGHLKASGNWAQMSCAEDNPAEDAPFVYELTGFEYGLARPPQNEDDTKDIDASALDWLIADGWK